MQWDSVCCKLKIREETTNNEKVWEYSRILSSREWVDKLPPIWFRGRLLSSSVDQFWWFKRRKSSHFLGQKARFIFSLNHILRRVYSYFNGSGASNKNWNKAERLVVVGGNRTCDRNDKDDSKLPYHSVGILSFTRLEKPLSFCWFQVICSRSWKMRTNKVGVRAERMAGLVSIRPITYKFSKCFEEREFQRRGELYVRWSWSLF